MKSNDGICSRGSKHDGTCFLGDSLNKNIVGKWNIIKLAKSRKFVPQNFLVLDTKTSKRRSHFLQKCFRKCIDTSPYLPISPFLRVGLLVNKKFILVIS